MQYTRTCIIYRVYLYMYIDTHPQRRSHVYMYSIWGRCIYIHINVYVYTYACVHMYSTCGTRIYTHIWVYMYTHMGIYTHRYIYICIHLHTYGVYAYMYVQREGSCLSIYNVCVIDVRAIDIVYAYSTHIYNTHLVYRYTSALSHTHLTPLGCASPWCIY